MKPPPGPHAHTQSFSPTYIGYFPKKNLAVFVPLRYSPIPRLVCFYPPSLFRGDGHLAVCRCLLHYDALPDFTKQRCPTDITAVFLHSLE